MANILLVFRPQTEHRQSALCKSEIIPGDWLSRKVKQLPKEAFKLKRRRKRRNKVLQYNDIKKGLSVQKEM